ncbi:MAG: Asp-tRNA(Asn)/Glu-tRNA(Gln) amidotransferase subunit GatC [Candidatus Wildermuthbacteria bacterium]|nr:Asp-tRNA(Asn)/Glu-tRNA(Gln) amidotransferase subunit GatC [Candidatus Wildermuthbacteria bacterium]
MITKEEVQHIANLARIRVNEKDIEKLQQDLSEILEYFNVLKEVDVSGVEPMTHSIALESVSRDDIARLSNPILVQKLINMFPLYTRSARGE